MEEKIYKLLDLIKKRGHLPDCEYEMTALEAVLLAVDGDVSRGREGTVLQKQFFSIFITMVNNIVKIFFCL